jgi:phosphoglycolate phosphatase
VTDTLASHLAALPAVRVVYTDLDGTLLGPGGSLLTGPDGRPSARAAAALVDAASAGVVVVPVSGRRRLQLQHDARLLGLDSCIAEAGTVIVRGGAVHFEWGQSPRGVGETPHDALVEAGALAALVDAFGTQLCLYEPWHLDREGSVLLRGRVDVAEADAVLAAAGCGWARLVDNGSVGRNLRAYHLLPRGVGKAEAVTDDLRDRGVPPSAAAAVGDSEEDRRMADVVGTYVRVANGHGADGSNVFVAPGANGDGFADAVEALLAAADRPPPRERGA